MDKVIIDTSIWIEAFRPQGEKATADRVKGLVLDNRVLLPGLIKAELLRSAKSQAEFNQLKDLLSGLNYLPTPEPFWDDLSSFSFSLFRKGLAIPLVDTAIALLCLENNAPLFHRDHHFDLITKVTDLQTIDLTR
ncbi:MAG: PIN domain-containing protein [Desulfobacterales bacterium]|nr:PIN domain-containing protein [Desulfobacterales bacterium]